MTSIPLVSPETSCSCETVSRMYQGLAEAYGGPQVPKYSEISSSVMITRPTDLPLMLHWGDNNVNARLYRTIA